jgi:hypothetical protein
MKVVRWLFLAAAVAGLVQTPFLIPESVAQMRADHRLIAIYPIGFAIRFLFIGLFAKLWWDTRKKSDRIHSDSRPKP